MNLIDQGELDVILTTPEKLLYVAEDTTSWFVQKLIPNIACMCVDEAHLGDDPSEFRADGLASIAVVKSRAYNELAKTKSSYQTRIPVLILTATPFPNRVDELCQVYGVDPMQATLVRTSLRRRNLTIEVIHMFLASGAWGVTGNIQTFVDFYLRS
jgi:superfamily II DNA helicase RecQ